mmetsp:Transcript_27314/g.56957  ORF Transcript_27314/g.56957 Transcript_27314/m.56957 type:complete len:431 (+) Transcript_27314:186-1478(+)
MPQNKMIRLTMESSEEHGPNSNVAQHTDLLGASKLNDGRRYGSTGTFSTVALTTSSSSSSSEELSPVPSNANDKFHHLSLDLTSIDNNDSSEKITLTPGHSRESSSSTYSDISSDGGGYYNRFARHRQQSRDAWYFFENSVFTLNNFKVITSLSLWFVSYMIMGIFGGSVAYMHFERRDKSIPDPLPDFGYDVVPYWCPHIPHVPHGNVQSVVLFILYSIILSGVALRWNPKHHPKSGTVIGGGDGRLILQHMCHLNCLVFLTRTSVVGLTGLPQPNPKCTEQQHFPVSFANALKFVMGRGFPPHACGDLIYSGHVGCTLISMAVLHRHGFMRNRLTSSLIWLIAAIGIYFTISCRSHYSVDVMLAFYFGYFLPEWYYNRSDERVGGAVSRWIGSLEVRPADLRLPHYEDINDCDEKQVDSPRYPATISV